MNVHQVIADLSRDRIRNINLIRFMQQYPVNRVDRIGESYLVRGTSDHTWVYISSADPHEFARIIPLLSAEDQYFAVMEDWMLPDLLAGQPPVWQLTCMKLYFPQDIPVPDAKTAVVGLVPETAGYIFAHSHYKDFTSVEYITERINMGDALGIYGENGRLAAWLMTHDDGAMGFLHVLPEWRGKGYARDLSLELIRRLRGQGRIPFVHIEESNKPSMTLATAMGFVPDRRIHWFQRRTKEL